VQGLPWHERHVTPPVPQEALLVPAMQFVPEQQPPGHDTLSQTQLPPRHRLPAAQAGVLPHWQLPMAEHPSAVKVSQAMHDPPPSPQVATARAWQMPLAQQPFGQEVALQTQLPPEQTLPAPQVGPFPQMHEPVAGSQPSAMLVLHVAQTLPATPQAATVGALHAPFRQQPFGQDWALQTHELPTHNVPPPQAGLVPQRHSPEAEQRLARVTSHETQAAPLTPQVASAAPVQVEPEQHPLGQLPALQPLHTPPKQVCTPQSWQEAPPLPQAELEAPAAQVDPAQQPLGQDVPSQTQAPARQRCPAAHAGPVPQAQAPLARHWSAVIPHAAQAPPPLPQAASDGVRQAPAAQQPFGQETPSHTQRPALQCWPAAHIAPPPQTQAPVAAEQPSARTGSQLTHAAPPDPHVVSDAELHVAPVQQPFGQLLASHPHDPPEQR
jgi:hypothetical protein